MSDSPRKFYSLPMFPYPSGTAMHVGHASNFLVNEIVARYHRMLGDKVLFPIGYDSFGLPTENYAIKHNKSAHTATQENITYFEEQLAAMDFSFDMDRVFKTSDPEYYRWTQWIFTKLYQHNLVYRKDGLVNWCNGCQTVLANDQVVDGRCERCDTTVIQKKHQQRYIKITDYADQLLDYTGCDRPTETKVHQTNWIGKSQGCEASFMIADDMGTIADDDKSKTNSDLTYKIIGCAYKVHKELGSGLSEKIYHNAMKVALQNEGLKISAEEKIEYSFDGQKVGVGLMDLVVEGSIVLELKSRKEFQAENYKQLRTYIKQGNYETGLLLNFYNNKVETKRLDADHPTPSEKIIRDLSTGSSDIIGENHPTSIVVFTTRIDTIYGVTAIVLAPENTIIDQYLTNEKKSEIATYRTVTAAKTAIERQHTDKEKTGFDSGVQVFHPLTGELVPVWYADYVLPDYATGAVMFVPAHDQRDWEFAYKYGIAIKKVIAKETGIKRHNELYANGGAGVVFDPKSQKYAVAGFDDGKLLLFAGGVDEGESVYEGILREVREESGLYDVEYSEHIETSYAHYHNTLKNINRYARAECLLIILKSTALENTALEEHEKFSLVWKTAEDILSNWKERNIEGDLDHYISFLTKSVAHAIQLGYDTTSDKNMFVGSAMTDNGILENSGIFNGLDNLTAKSEIAQHLESIGKGKITTTYRLRDWSVSRQRYWGSPIPIYYTFEDNGRVPYFERSKKEGANYTSRKSARTIIKHPTQDLYCFIKNNDGIVCIGGGLDTDESYIDAASREIIEETGYDDFILKSLDTEYHYTYYKSSEDTNYYHTSQLFYCELKSLFQREYEEHEGTIEWLTIEQVREQNDVALNFYMDVVLGLKPNLSTTTDRYNAYNPHPDKSKWIPHLIPESDLPVVLPLDLPNYKPAGKSPLEDHPTFKYYHASDGQVYLRECDTLDTFMCSSFYFLRFCDPHNDEELISDEAARQWMPVDLYVGGKEHTVGHLLYSRFIYKFLRTEGYVACESSEPFAKLVHQGMVHASDGRKMSKRRGNVIDPMEIVHEYGSDTLRVYTMFMGPVEASKNRNPDAVAGVHRFLKRVEKLAEKIGLPASSQIREGAPQEVLLGWNQQGGGFDTKEPIAPSHPRTLAPSNANNIISLLHQTIQGVTEDIEALKFNTVVSKLMIMTNAFAELDSIQQSDYLIFLQLLAPFATKVTQQLRTELDQQGSIHESSRPEYDLKLIIASTIDLPIQINGKLRGTVKIDAGASQDSVMELAQSHDNITKRLEGQIIKIIYIQDKICNIIIK